MKTRPVLYDDLEQAKFCTWSRKVPTHRGRHLFTILTKDSSCGRGQYSEEFDVLAVSKGEAIKIAQAVLDHDYEPGLRISRVVWRGQR
jgi:hypothetical protein